MDGTGANEGKALGRQSPLEYLSDVPIAEHPPVAVHENPPVVNRTPPGDDGRRRLRAGRYGGRGNGLAWGTESGGGGSPRPRNPISKPPASVSRAAAPMRRRRRARARASSINT